MFSIDWERTCTAIIKEGGLAFKIEVEFSD